MPVSKAKRTRVETVEIEYPDHYLEDGTQRGRLVDLLLRQHDYNPDDMRACHLGLYSDDADTVERAKRVLDEMYRFADEIMAEMGIAL